MSNVRASNPPLQSLSFHHSRVFSDLLRQGPRYPDPPGHYWQPGWHAQKHTFISAKYQCNRSWVKKKRGWLKWIVRDRVSTSREQMTVVGFLIYRRLCFILMATGSCLSYLTKGVLLKLLNGTFSVKPVVCLKLINKGPVSVSYSCRHKRCSQGSKLCCQGAFLQFV